MITKTTKTRLLNALRSSKYAHTKGNMIDKKTKAYTVLGVLCEVTGNSKNRKMNRQFPRTDRQGNVLDFMGLSPSTQQRISMINDSCSDFSQVIRYISRNLKVKA